MCEPTTIIAASMAVAQGVSQYSTAQATGKAARSAYATRNKQIDQSVAENNMERARAARRERARILAMAGESGVGGASVNAQLMDSRFQEGYDRTLNRTQGLWNKQAARHTTQNQLAKIPSTAAIALNTGLKIGNAYMMGMDAPTQTLATNHQGQSIPLTNNTAFVKNM